MTFLIQVPFKKPLYGIRSSAVLQVFCCRPRHGSEHGIFLPLTLEENRLYIVIQDNGRGFVLGQSPSGNGLVNLQERMDKLHDQCQIHSSPGPGTTVSLTLPLPTANGV